MTAAAATSGRCTAATRDQSAVRAEVQVAIRLEWQQVDEPLDRRRRRTRSHRRSDGVTERGRDADRRVPTPPPAGRDPCERDDQQPEVDGQQHPRADGDVRRRQRSERRAETRTASPHRGGDRPTPPTTASRTAVGRRGTLAKRGDATIAAATAAAPPSHAASVTITSTVGSSGRRAAPTTVSSPAAPIEIRATSMRAPAASGRSRRRRRSGCRSRSPVPTPAAGRPSRRPVRLSSTGRRLSQPSQIEAASAAHPIAAASGLHAAPRDVTNGIRGADRRAAAGRTASPRASSRTRRGDARSPRASRSRRRSRRR